MANHPKPEDNVQSISTMDVTASPDEPASVGQGQDSSGQPAPQPSRGDSQGASRGPQEGGQISQGARKGVATPVSRPGDPLPREETRTGIQEEIPVWHARYSYKNFIGRLLLRALLTLGWLALAAYTWGYDHGYEQLPMITWLLGGILVLLWVVLAWQIVRARLGHYYEMTTKRLFVATGVFHRRRDQVEMLRVDDVYVKQPSMFHRMFNVGTVVVESSEERLPITYIAGIDSPHEVMDLIWHHARTERDLHSVKVDEV